MLSIFKHYHLSRPTPLLNLLDYVPTNTKQLELFLWRARPDSQTHLQDCAATETAHGAYAEWEEKGEKK